MEDLKRNYLGQLLALETAYIDDLIARLEAHGITRKDVAPNKPANPLRGLAVPDYARNTLVYSTLHLSYKDTPLSITTDVHELSVRLSITAPLPGRQQRRLARWHTKSWEAGHISKFNETSVCFKASTLPELVKKLNARIKKSESAKKLQEAERKSGKLKTGNYYT